MTLLGPHIELPPVPLPVAGPVWWLRRPRTRPPLRRIWPAFVSIPVSLMVAGVITFAAALLWVLLSGGLTGPSPQDSFVTMLGTVAGVVIIVGGTQLGFGGTAMVAGAASREGFRRRLGLRRIKARWWTVLLFLTPAAIPLGMMVIIAPLAQSSGTNPFAQPLGDDPSAIEMLGRLMTVGDTWWQAVIVVAMLSLLPGIMEELLFRGYVLHGLLRRIPPVGAIFITAVLFTLVHLNPLQMIVLLPLSVYLGFVTWRCGSVIPAMLIHTLNNLAIVGTIRVTSGMSLWDSDVATGFCMLIGLALLLLGGAGAIGAIVMLIMMGRDAKPVRPIAFPGSAPFDPFPRRRRASGVRYLSDRRLPPAIPEAPLPPGAPPWPGT